MKKFIITAFAASTLVIASSFSPALASPLGNETLIGQVMFPSQKDYEYKLQSNQKHTIFQEQTGLCGLFSLYNGYALMNKIKPITQQAPHTSGKSSTPVQKVQSLLGKHVPVENLEYFKNFEAFFTESTSLVLLEDIKKNYTNYNKTETEGIGKLSLNLLQKIILAHQKYTNDDNILVTSLYLIQYGIEHSWPQHSAWNNILQAANRFRSNPYKPLLVILCINKKKESDPNHAVALLFTKDVTWIADSCNHQDNILVDDPDITFIDECFRRMPLPQPLIDQALAVEHEIDYNPNYSQELLECFAAEPGTVFSKPLTSKA